MHSRDFLPRNVLLIRRSYNRSALFRHFADNVPGLYSYKIHNRRQPYRLKTKPHRVPDGIRAAFLGFVPTDGGAILRGSSAALGERLLPLVCLQTCRFPSLSEIDLQIVRSNSLWGRLLFLLHGERTVSFPQKPYWGGITVRSPDIPIRREGEKHGLLC